MFRNQTRQTPTRGERRYILFGEPGPGIHQQKKGHPQKKRQMERAINLKRGGTLSCGRPVKTDRFCTRQPGRGKAEEDVRQGKEKKNYAPSEKGVLAVIVALPLQGGGLGGQGEGKEELRGTTGGKKSPSAWGRRGTSPTKKARGESREEGKGNQVCEDLKMNTINVV